MNQSVSIPLNESRTLENEDSHNFSKKPLLLVYKTIEGIDLNKKPHVLTHHQSACKFLFDENLIPG